MKNYYKKPKKSIQKYFSKSTSKSNDVKETRKEIKDKKARYAMTHKKVNKRAINRCIKCEKNKEGFCTKYGQWCSSVNDLCTTKK